MFPGSSEYNYKPPLGSSINWNHPLSQGLVNCFLFNELNGLRIYDLAKDNHGNLLNGPIWNSSNNGYLQFDGNNDTIDFGDNLDIGLSSYTFCTSFRASSLSGSLHGLFSKSIAADAIQRYALFIYNAGGNYKIGTFISNGGSSDVQPPSVINVVANVWYHVVVVFDRSDKVYLYVNGNLDSSATISQFQSVDFQSSYNFRIGSYGDAANNPSFFFNGSISNLQIYNRALSAEEIRSNYENPYQFINPPSSLKYYSYRQQGILYAPSITSAESMGSAIMPGPVTLGVNSILSTESFGKPYNSLDIPESGLLAESIRFDSNLPVTDLNPILSPAISSITAFGTTGSTVYTYQISAYNKYGETLPSSVVKILNGNSSLDSTNYNRVRWTKVPKATGYRLYGRTENNIKLITDIYNNYYDDVGITLQNIIPVTKNTSGYDHKKLNVSEEHFLFSGPNYLDNYISIKHRYDYNHGVLQLYPGLGEAFAWSDDITWIITDEWRNWNIARFHLHIYDKRTNTIDYAGNAYVNFPITQNLQPYDKPYASYNLVNNGTVSVSGTTVTGSSTTWNDQKLCVGYRIGFGSDTPQFVTDWYEIGAINSNTSITLTNTANSYPANTPYVIEELMIVSARFNGSDFTRGGLFVVKGLSYFDFTNEKITFIPAATTVDRIKASYYLDDSVNQSYWYPNFVCGPKVDNNTQYVYVASLQNNTSTSNHLLVFNLRADLTSLSSGSTTSAFISRSNTFATINAPPANTGKLTLATTISGAGKDIECLYLAIYGRNFRIPTKPLLVPNNNVIIYEYSGVFGNGGYTVGGGWWSLRHQRYLPEEDMFYGMEYSYGQFCFYRYKPGLRDAIKLKRRYLSPHYSYPHNKLVYDIGYDHNWSLAPVTHIANGSIFIHRESTDQWNPVQVISYKADELFAKKYNAFVITPVISTYNARKLSKIILADNFCEGDDRYTKLPAEYNLYIRTEGIEDNSGVWIPLNRMHDLSDIKATDKCQFRFEFVMMAHSSIPRKIFNLDLLYETKNIISPEFKWNLSDSSTLYNVVGFKQKELYKKDYVLYESEPLVVIEAKDAISGNVIYTQISDDNTYGQFQYYNNSWVNGIGSQAIEKRMRYVNTYSFNSTAKIIYNIYTIKCDLLRIDKFSDNDLSDYNNTLILDNVTRSTEIDRPWVFSGNSSVTVTSASFNKLYSDGLCMSITFMVNENISFSNMSLLSRNNGSTGNNFYHLYISSDYKINFWIGNSSVIVSDGNIKPGYIYNIIVNFTGTNYSLYINGKLNKTQNISPTLTLASSSFKIGNSGYSNSGFYGKIYEVRIIGKSVTNNEISRIYSDVNFKLDNEITGLVRKTLPSSIYYSEGTISIDAGTSNINVPGLRERFYRFYDQNRDFDHNNGELMKDYEHVHSFDLPYHHSIFGYTIDYYGKFYAPTTGSYTFTYQAWATGYMWIGNIADTGFTKANRNIYTNTGIISYSVNLNGGEYYSIRIMNSCAGDRRTLFTVSGPGITSTSNLYGYLFTPYTNRKTLTGTGTSFINNIPFSRNTLFLGSKSIYDNVEVVEVTKALSDTKLAFNTLPNKIYSSNIDYAILKNVVLYLDASEKKSYPESGNIWYDLSGYGNHFQCQGHVEWNKAGYFTTFSVNDFFTPVAANTLAKSYPFYNQDFTIFFVIRNQTVPNQYGVSDNCMLLYQGSSNPLYGYYGRGTELSYACNTRYYYTSDNWQSTYSVQRFYVENYDENTVLTFSYSNTSNSTTIYGYERFRMYKDGQKFLITNRVAASLETLYGFFSIGNSPNYPLYPFSDGKIYAMMVVNRTMSDSEVLEMSNYFRDKFNF
jgi:hypothetical protein